MREFRLIREALDKFALDLKGLSVLTEAASGNYVWTPIIASLAGAEVYAFTKDSRFATFDEVRDRTLRLSGQLALPSLRVIRELTPEILGQADIITNTGFLRPLGEGKLQHCKSTVAVPLMYETWEYRASDIDLKYCFKRNIPVLGTNEADNRLRTIDYLGNVVRKALFEQGIEVFNSSVVILGAGKFARSIYDSLIRDAAVCNRWDVATGVDWDFLGRADAVIVADHETDELYIGKGGLINAARLARINPGVAVVHVSGKVDEKEIRSMNVALFPPRVRPPRHMSLTTDFVGPKPIIDLHTAGLKVGEILVKNYTISRDYRLAIKNALHDSIAQDFSPAQKEFYYDVN